MATNSVQVARHEYLRTQISYSAVLHIADMPEFSEYTVRRWGDVAVYRIYGTNSTNFMITER